MDKVGDFEHDLLKQGDVSKGWRLIPAKSCAQHLWNRWESLDAAVRDEFPNRLRSSPLAAARAQIEED